MRRWLLLYILFASFGAVASIDPLSCDQTGEKVMGRQQSNVNGRKSTSLIRMAELYRLPPENPLSRFQRMDVILKSAWGQECTERNIGYRYYDPDRTSAEGFAAAISDGRFDQNTALFADSGHAHSVAMAAVMAERTPILPVIMKKEFPSHSSSVERSGAAQFLAALRFFEPLFMESGKSLIRWPAFIFDIHRLSDFRPSELPSADILKSLNIRKILWALESKDVTDTTPVRADSGLLAYGMESFVKGKAYHRQHIRTAMAAYADKGLEVYILRIDPYSYRKKPNL